MPDNVALYGGFAGSEADREERNPETNPTVLSGDLDGDDVTGNYLDNSNRVVKLINSHSPANRLDGFTIQGGHADFTPTRNTGAGIYVENAQIMVANCLFYANFASNNGGAVYVKSGDLLTSKVTLQNCTFTRNGSYGFGATIFATPNNAGTQYPSLVIEDSLFQNNEFQYPVSANSAVIALRRCYFMDNEGGALSANDRVTLTAENCVFMRNGGMSGSVYIGTRSTADILHCTLAENYTKEVYVVADTYLATRLSINNSIVWNNDYPAVDLYSQTAANAEVLVTGTLISGGYAGEGNMDVAPRFRLIEPPGHPNWDSPSIDFCAESSLVEDIEGQPRPQNNAFDAGAYEFGEDTDGGGLPDWYEIEHALLSEVAEDDTADTDEDGLSNLEEFRRGSDPRDDASPASKFYVSQEGSDETGDGSSSLPWKTLTHAMRAMPEGAPTFPLTLYVGPGVYEERVVFRPYVNVIGAGAGATILRHYDSAEPDRFVVMAAVATSLQNCTVTLPSPVSETVDLIRASDTDILIADCVLDGLNSPRAIGVFITGPNSSSSVIRDTTVRRVEYGVYAADSGVNITRNLFEDILADAIFVRPPEGKQEGEAETPLLGTGEQLEDTGFNRFRMVTGFFINNTSESLTLAEYNDWGVYTEEEIENKMLNSPGAVDYDPYIGKMLVRGMLAVELREGVTYAVIPSSASPSVQLNTMAGAHDASSNLYLFTNLDAATYTCIATAVGYISETRLISLAAGEMASTTILLQKKPHEEGEGEPEEGELPTWTVPDLTGHTEEEAAAMLTTAGLALGVVSEQYHDTVPLGQVISQSPAAGAEVAPGTTVAITVSLGKEPEPSVTVPHVTGKTRAEAEATLTTAGLVLGTVSEQYHDTVPPGQVISQSPAAGAEVTIGATVAITISLGKKPDPLIQMPELVGKARAEAEAVLIEAGLILGTVSEQYHNTVPAGQVISQSPLPGTQVAPSSIVAITVSMGKEPETLVPVPDVVGKTREEAGAFLAGAGLILGTVSEQYHDTIPLGKVISQSPAAGAEVTLGATVAITISLGKEPEPLVQVPELVGKTRAEAEAVLIEAGLILGTESYQYHDNIPLGQVISQSPLGNTEVASGTAVAITLSLGKEPAPSVTVPDILGMTREEAEAALVATGLVLGAVSDQYHPTIAAGLIISQTPQAGAQVPPQSGVSITISLGIEPEPLTLQEVAELLLQDFATADANGDTQLDFTEAHQGAPAITNEQFTQLDINGDGIITEAELEEALQETRCGCGCSGNDAKTMDVHGLLEHWLLFGMSLVLLCVLSQRPRP